MSGPQPQLRISPKAASDIKQILKYKWKLLEFRFMYTYKTPGRDTRNFPHSGLKASFYRSELSQILAK